ncbi:hypothetical protein ACFL4S_00005, partial [bacterium]
ADNLFSFAETAKQRFEDGSLETKKTILSCLGSNFILKDNILDITLNPVLEIVGKIAPEVRDLHSRLEPIKPQVNQRYLEDLYAKNEVWGG